MRPYWQLQSVGAEAHGRRATRPGAAAVAGAREGENTSGDAGQAVRPLVCAALYAFVFSFCFEMPNRNIPLDVPTIGGCVLLLAALLQPRICFRRPPTVFWWFAAYLPAYVLSALVNGGDYPDEVFHLLLCIAQAVLIFWVAYNLLRHEGVARGALVALVLSCLLRSLIQRLGIANSTFEADDAARLSAFGQNPNAIARILAAGMLALLGLAYAADRPGLGYRFLIWPAFALVGSTIIHTGSRGGVLSLAAGAIAFLFRRGDTWLRLKTVAVVALGIGVLALAYSRSDSLRFRFERTIETDSMGGRERIFPEAWQMFLESPLIGQGPINNKYALGYKLQLPDRWRRSDTHNLFLEVLSATGVVGAVPFFVGLWLCLAAGWKARAGPYGVTPIALVAAVLVANMSGNWIASKFDWFLLAYAVAAAAVVLPGRDAACAVVPVPSRAPGRLRRPNEFPAHPPATGPRFRPAGGIGCVQLAPVRRGTRLGARATTRHHPRAEEGDSLCAE